MKSNYNRIGDYIHKVDKRNTDLKVDNLRGLSMTKEFRLTTSNIVGTDMSVYKVMSKWQFACDFMSVIRVYKLPVVLKTDDEPNLVSPAYPVFEVNDINELHPEYLMMWLRRPEFDRYAFFKCDSAIRGGFDWEELCDATLPVPSINKQKEIVKEYNVLVDRINLNNRLVQKLEETAQTIYKQWFVDFEFPNGNGKSYKSNGGEMVESELGKIPKGWRVESYDKVMDFKTGKLNSNAAIENGKYPFFTCSSETFRTNTFSFNTEAVLLAGNNASAIYPLKYFVGKFDAYQRTYVITSKCDSLSNKQIFFTIRNELENFKGISSGTATKFLTMNILNDLKLVIADKSASQRFELISSVIFKKLQIAEKARELLNTLHDIVLSKLATIGG